MDDGSGMKNIQIIDGAANSTFDIYQIPDELFQQIFPAETDIAFQNDVEIQFQNYGYGDEIWETVYQHKIAKKNVIGIHGTLHLTGSNTFKKYFPRMKEADIPESELRLRDRFRKKPI